jgi:dihydrodipicolinate synthase/N-acetylneuraminate lyase
MNKIDIQTPDARALEGLVVPPCTPFTSEGAIDERSYAAHLELLAEAGVTRLLVNGTTAEFASLTPAERQRLLVVSRRHFPHLIAFNTGSDSLVQACETAQWGADHGADVIVAMAPYYFAGVGEEGLVQFFDALAGSVELPLVLYNFPKHTGNALTPEILRRVKHIAVKDSSGDSSLMAATPCYLAGTSKRVVESMAAGAKGFVCALACCMPEQYVALETALQAGQTDAAEAIQKEIRERATAFAAPNEIACIKRDLASQIPNYPMTMRLPLLAASD